MKIRAECEHGRTEPHPLWDASALVLDDLGEQEWVRCDREDPPCDLEVVRPGKVQCSGEYNKPCGQGIEPEICEPPDVRHLLVLSDSYLSWMYHRGRITERDLEKDVKDVLRELSVYTR